MAELKNCPFCGGEAVLETTIGRKGYDACVFCNCSASVCSVTCDDVSEAEIDAIAAWNRRAQPDNEPLTLEELEEYAKKIFGWVWINVLKPYTEHQKNAYYQIYSDYTEGTGLCCGYPGLGFTYNFADYGKTWLAYDHEPHATTSNAAVEPQRG